MRLIAFVCKTLILGVVIFQVVCLFWAGNLFAASAYSPRHSGLEPPGGPKSVGVMPGGPSTRMDDNSLGHTDAYGRPVSPGQDPENIKKNRLLPGAYGSYGNTGKNTDASYLPDMDAGKGNPVWSFR